MRDCCGKKKFKIKIIGEYKMKAKSRFTLSMIVVWTFLFILTPLVQAQEVKVKLDESTYGISAQKLKGIANDLIGKHLSRSKSKSWRVHATMKAVGEDYNKGTLNYEMTVTFLHKKNYTAEVKTIRFALDNGKTTGAKVITTALPRLRPIKKVRLLPKCKTKQGIIIKPSGVLQVKKIPLKRITPKKQLMIKNPVSVSTQQIATIQQAELSRAKWWYAKGLAETPCNTIPTAVSGTQKVYATFSKAFGKGNAAMRLGDKATVGEISNFLKYDSKLLAWNNIGHGWQGGIVLWDGNLTATVVQNLKPNRGLQCAVVLLNSCVTFKEPLKSAFLSNFPRTYIAGAIYLPIGPSEKVDICFWNDVLLGKSRMDTTLTKCSKDQNLVGGFGLSGDGGKFWH
jgi:hypothetical protein